MSPNSRNPFANRWPGRTGGTTALVLALLALPSAGALAASGGVTAPGSAPAPGGAGTAPQARSLSRPVAAHAFCSQACLGVRTALRGSLVEVTGEGLQSVTHLEFARRRRTVRVPAAAAGAGQALGRVPRSLPAGAYRIRAVSNGRRRSRATRRALTVRLGGASRFRSTQSPRVVSSEATPRRLFVGSRRSAAFQFVLRASGPTQVQVDVLRASDGAVVRSFGLEAPANALSRVYWDGRDGAGGQLPEGAYALVARPAGVAAAAAAPRARSSQTPNVDRIVLIQHAFPVRGRHDYGGRGANFGSGRSGHSHQGQDVFARCGTPLVAARSGRVRFNQFHRAAGYYLVIDGDDTDLDYAYMHLRKRSRLARGAHVATGQAIGEVGDTGNARGCHLHFELWRGEWQGGGSPIDPLPYLRDWDRTS